jgi:hypothetical protein
MSSKRSSACERSSRNDDNGCGGLAQDRWRREPSAVRPVSSRPRGRRPAGTSRRCRSTDGNVTRVGSVLRGGIDDRERGPWARASCDPHCKLSYVRATVAGRDHVRLGPRRSCGSQVCVIMSVLRRGLRCLQRLHLVEHRPAALFVGGDAGSSMSARSARSGSAVRAATDERGPRGRRRHKALATLVELATR